MSAPGDSPGPGDSTAPVAAASAGTVYTGAHDAIIVVDVQRDFCPGGSLPVPEGDTVVPVINRILPYFGRWIYTRDWHPAAHVSFAAQPEFRHLSWPPHAVQGTPGAGWCADLDMPMNAILVSKGDDPQCEAYSGFQVQRLDLAEFLHLRKVERIFICGLALDYCVRQTALDARAAGFTVYLLEDAVRAITPEGATRTLAELEAVGVIRLRSDQLVDSGERPPAAYDQDGNPIHHHDD